QSGNLNGGSRGKIRGEVFGVHLVHAREIRQIGQEDSAFDHIGEGKLLIVENGFDVFEHSLGLGFDVAADQVPRGRVERNLARAEEQIPHANGMVVWSGRRGRLGWLDNLLFWHN